MSATLAVYRYDPDKAELLGDCMLPLAVQGGTEPGVRASYLERGWYLGPSIRWHVAGEHTLLDRCRSRIDAYVASHPSGHNIDATAYETLSRRLGEIELVAPPYLPLRPDNSIEIQTYAGRVDLLGSQQALEFKERYLTMAMPVLMREQPRWRHGSAAQVTLELLAALAASYPNGGIAAGSLSLRSHAEEFLLDHDSGGSLRARFESWALVHRSIVSDAVERAATSDATLAAEWRGLITEGWRMGLGLAREGVIDIDSAHRMLRAAEHIGDSAALKWDRSRRRNYSAFHQELQRVNYVDEPVDSENFSAYRWQLNFTYQLLPLMGVNPVERCLLCHAIAEETDRHLGHTWRDRLDSIHREYARP